MKILYILLWIIIVGILLHILNSFLFTAKAETEPFNDETGRFCSSCRGKTPNQCFRCFNCGFCVNKNGEGGCIGGDHTGPYNFEKCEAWYHTDPYSFMMQRNKGYGCEFGIKAKPRKSQKSRCTVTATSNRLTNI